MAGDEGWQLVWSMTWQCGEADALQCDTWHRFVTRGEVDKMSLGHLIGTPLLRAYMHGYFVDNRLYRKAASLAQPFAYETYRKQQIEAKLEAARESRISLVRKLPKVRHRLNH